MSRRCLSARCLVAIAGLLFLSPPGRSAEPEPAERPTGSGSRAIVLLDRSLPGDPELARLVGRLSREAGYAVSFLSVAELVATLGPDTDLLALPQARSLPVELVEPLLAFLKAGGDLLALGAPALDAPLVRRGDGWMTREQYDEALRRQAPEAVLIDFDSEVLSRWVRHSNDRVSPARHEIVEDPTLTGGGDEVLHVEIENLTGWDTLAGPLLSGATEPKRGAFRSGHTLTCFRARGGSDTTQLAVEWIERDGSRWIATVDLEPEWRQYALAPEAFRAWEPSGGRGGPGDHLRVESAVRFTVGLAFTHTRVPGGRHEYWLSDVGTASNPLGGEAPPLESGAPRLESLCPAYQFYTVAAGARLSTPDELRLLGLGEPADLFDAPSPLLAMHPRPRGVGFDKERPWRWQPLLVARAPNGDHRGAIAAFLGHVFPPYRGGLWLTFTPVERSFYETPSVRSVLRRALSATRRGLFLREGGAEFYTLFESQPVRLGARVFHAREEKVEDVSVRLKVEAAVSPTRVVLDRTWPLSIDASSERVVETVWTPEAWSEGGYRVTVDLVLGGEVIDRLTHDLQVWRPPQRPRFVEARDGGLWLDGKSWKAHGVNYMPSSGIGVANGLHFEYWLDPAPYDPAIIDRDLRRVKDMGLNAVSVFVYHRSLRSQNLLDFLRRCRDLGLRVNQSLRPGTPMDFRWEEIRELIEYYRLAENDTVLAYDLAWEPSHYGDEHQKAYAPLWTEWVRARFGSVAAAEEAWGYPAPRPSGSDDLAVPSMDLLTRDGEWREMVADYRCFLDDLVRDRYTEARRRVRSVDGRHPVSFRMQHAGDPTYNWDAMLPYDMVGLAGAVDIWEPEAYGRIGDWERVKPGRFTADYARLCDPAKPVVWAEMGENAWDASRARVREDRLQFIADYYRRFYRMMRESGADGVFFWWYPGGFRVGENSDFGIIDPDGTDRPVTRVIREEGPRFLEAPRLRRPDCWIELDRRADARGLFGAYEAVKDRYWEAVAAGKTPGLRWAREPCAEPAEG